MFSNFSKGFIGILFCFCILPVSAQELPTEHRNYTYRQEVEPMGLDFYKFSPYYYNGKKIYNLLGEPIGTKQKEIKSLKLDPSGNNCAVLVKKGKKSKVLLYNLWFNNTIVRDYDRVKKPTAISYTPDGRQFLIAAKDYIHFFKAGGGGKLYKIPIHISVNDMKISPDSKLLASYNDSKIAIWELNGKGRIELSFDSSIKDIAFSSDSGKMAVLTSDGVLALYDTSAYSLLQKYDGLGDARSCSFHPEGTYISVVTSDERICIFNLDNKYDRDFIESEEGGIKQAQFVKDGNNKVYLCYSTKGSIVYDYVGEINSQSKIKLFENELDDRMADWKKMMPGESLEEYNLRMSEDNLMKQTRMFEQEIATRLAENLVQDSEISFGSYSPDKQMLALNFDNMPSIYLDVPSEDINDFMNPGLLEFRNEKYILGQDEKFELTYAEVYNTATGKQYVFDNQERMSLDFLNSDEDFIPLNFVQQSSMEEMKLQEIKEEIVTTAKQNEIISDHTNISVDSRIVPSHDADGNRINNYNINFSYEVESGFSVHEDFAPGKYKVEDSGAARSMLSIIKTALEGEFAQYVKEGKKLQIVITGMADALKINKKIAYDGAYGDFIEEPVYKNDELNNISVTRKSGITENEQLAFLRAVGVKEYIGRNVNDLDKMDVEYRYNINLTSGTGGEFRRITVGFTFVDAFIQ